MNAVIISMIGLLVCLILFLLNTRITILRKEIEEIKENRSKIDLLNYEKVRAVSRCLIGNQEELDSLKKINSNLTKRIVRLESKLRKNKNGNG